MPSMFTTRILSLQLLLAFLQQFSNNGNQVVVNAALPCSDDSFCEQMIRSGSYCIMETEDESSHTPTGVCSNPFAQGCLRTLLPERLESSNGNIENLSKIIEQFHTILEGRICNSDDIDINSSNDDDEDDDGDTGSDKTHCKKPLFDYPEIRVHGANWESSIFISWIMQIVLMEILEVPVSIGLGPSGVGHNSGMKDNTYDASFYNPYNTLSYSSQAYPWHALKVASEVGECHLLQNIEGKETGDDGSTTTATTMEPCAHVLPEVSNQQMKEWRVALQEGYISNVESLGEILKFGWYVPSYTATDYDDSLVSFYGIRGEENRQKVAEAFKRPIQWKYYCENISSTNCTEPDTVATHYPLSESEQTSYFAGSQYTGYFHFSDKNNCTKNPTTCTGVIIGPPCTWSTNIDAQIYWNDLVGLEADGPLKPNGGYSYSAMTQIWRAANATKSNVLMWWWKPEALVEEFYGTAFQFHPFLLPEATDTCANARTDTASRCSADINVRRGLKDGACDQEAHAQSKGYASSLKYLTLRETNLAYRSPGYEVIQNIRITDLQMANLMRRWVDVDTDKYGYDPREAVCSWVVDNLEYMLYSIPDGYPRKLDTETSYHGAVWYTAIGIACFTNLIIWTTLGATFYYGQKRVMVFAQVYIVRMILVGFLLISIAAITVIIQPTGVSCTITVWLITIGYMFELIPILVKIAAINKILQCTIKLKRVHVSRKRMLHIMIFAFLVVVIFLTVWITIDPLSADDIRTLAVTGKDEDDQATLTGDNGNVLSNIKCNCNHYAIWNFIVLGFQAILLTMASVLAFQSRNVQQDFNESRSLGTMIYSHFMFLILRVILLVVDESFINSSSSNGGRIIPAMITSTIFSFLYSFDVLAALCIYVLPKVREAAISSDTGDTGFYIKRNNIRSSCTSDRSSLYRSSLFDNMDQSTSKERQARFMQNLSDKGYHKGDAEAANNIDITRRYSSGGSDSNNSVRECSSTCDEIIDEMIDENEDDEEFQNNYKNENIPKLQNLKEENNKEQKNDNLPEDNSKHVIKEKEKDEGNNSSNVSGERNEGMVYHNN